MYRESTCHAHDDHHRSFKTSKQLKVKIGYNIDVLLQTACLIVNPIFNLLTSLIARR